MTLWEIDIHPAEGMPDAEGRRIAADAGDLGLPGNLTIRATHGYLLQGDLQREQVERLAAELFSDSVVERTVVAPIGDALLNQSPEATHGQPLLIHVLRKPGVMDPVAQSAEQAIADFGLQVEAIRTLRKYWVSGLDPVEVALFGSKILANDSIEQIILGPLELTELHVGSPYLFELVTVPIRELDDDALWRLSREGQLYLTLVEMQTIQQYYRDLGRDPTDIELESLAQTWSEHCSHKTLAGRIAYRDENGEQRFENMLKETIFAATQEIRRRLGADDWCVSVFKDNAGVVRFDDQYNVVFKVETHNHPSALEPYGGANTGIGGVIRDPMGTGMGAKPVCNTDVFCFAPPDTPSQSLPPGVLHPRRVMKGVVSGVRDYGNRMGIPTVNGALYFDPRYLGNPLVYCGNVGLLPVDQSHKQPRAGDWIVAIGGRTGRDGIHGATFSSAELTSESETVSGGAVQIGNAITEKMVLDVLLQARERGLYNAVTDCGAGGFSSAVGEMGEEIGAEVWLERAPLKYEGLTYTEIWISEAQERMVLSVSPQHWEEFAALCRSEGVEATIIGRFEPTGRLELKYDGTTVGQLTMEFLHGGRPPVVREAVYQPLPVQALARAGEGGSSEFSRIQLRGEGGSSEFSRIQPRGEGGSSEFSRIQLQGEGGLSEFSRIQPRGEGGSSEFSRIQPRGEGGSSEFSRIQPRGEDGSSEFSRIQLQGEVGEDDEQDHSATVKKILGSLNVASKEWVIRQYDHEVQGGSAIKPLVGATNDGPGDAAVLRPVISSNRGLVIACGMNPRYGDLDPYRMAASAIDEAVRNCVAVGADPQRIAILDNFCWGYTDRPETLGSLVRAALACRDLAVALGTPFISGKDSLNNEFSYEDSDGRRQTISIPPSLLISAMGQVDDVRQCVTMDLKEPGNLIYLIGATHNELGGSHYALVHGLTGGQAPAVDPDMARRTFAGLHAAIRAGVVRACHDLSEGGLAVALAEMAFAGGWGARVSLDAVPHAVSPGDTPSLETILLFAESNSRFLCEVAPANQQEFERQLSGVPHALIGQVTAEAELTILSAADGEQRIVVAADVPVLKEAWQKPLRW